VGLYAFRQIGTDADARRAQPYDVVLHGLFGRQQRVTDPGARVAAGIKLNLWQGLRQNFRMVTVKIVS